MNSSNLNAESGTDLAKVIAVMSYLTLIGWVIALWLYGSHKSALARFHLRQSFGLIATAALFSLIPLIGWGLNIILAVFWLVSIYYALCEKNFIIPIIGQYYQTHLDFIR